MNAPNSTELRISSVPAALAGARERLSVHLSPFSSLGCAFIHKRDGGNTELLTAVRFAVQTSVSILDATHSITAERAGRHSRLTLSVRASTVSRMVSVAAKHLSSPV